VLVDHEEEIRRDLLEISSPSDRRIYLDAVCRDDPPLHARLQSWLANQEQKSASPSDAPVVGTGGLGMIGGRYHLLQEIGEGGFGTVYLAEQTAPVHRRVAIKILKLGMDSRQIVARFELERQALALMNHPNIAKVLDAGATDTGRPYFVMELVRGVPVTRFCQEEQLAIPQRLELFVQVCKAVQHAHQKGIIHRDLKPSNILVSTDGGSPAPKVIDFGIAKAIEPDLASQTLLTQEHQLLGTPAYISPEQAALASGDIDTRSDIYSLGVLLYELLTGSTPFDTQELLRSGLDEMRRTIREEEPVRPSTRLSRLRDADPGQADASTRLKITPGIDRDLDWIVLKCLQKDRALRYATANGLAMDIERHLKHEPVVARPPTLIYRVGKFTRRNPVAVSLAVLLLLAFVLAGVGGAWMSLKLSRAKRETDTANRRLSQTIQYLESEKIEELAGEGRRMYPLAWLASHMRKDPMDCVAASRALSMLSLHNFALPVAPPLLHDGPVNMAWFSPDGAQILTGSDDRTLRFWDATSGRLLSVITNAAGLATVHYGANGTRAYADCRDGVVRVFDTRSRKPVFEVRAQQRGLSDAVDTAQGSYLYVAQENHSVSRWDLRTGQRLEPTLEVPGRILQIEGSRSANAVAVANDGPSLFLLDASTGQLLGAPRKLNGVTGALRFTPDGRRLFASLDEGRRLAIWDFRSTPDVVQFTPPPPKRIGTLRFTPDGRRLISGLWGLPVRIWDAQTLQLLSEPAGEDRQGWAEYVMSGSGRWFAGVSQSGTARIWEVETGRLVLEPIEHQGVIQTLAFNSNDTQVLTASLDGTARLWDVRMRQPQPVVLPASTNFGEATFNHAGTKLLISAGTNAVQVCDARTGEPLGPLLRHPGGPHPPHLLEASFSQDDSRILTVEEGGLVRIWSVTSYQLERELTIQRSLLLARFSLDGRFVVAGDRTGRARIWSVDSAREVGVTDFGQDVTSLDFDPRGGAFVLACANGTARCWALPSGHALSPPLRHRGIVWSAVYSPDGQRILTASADHTAQIWDAQTGQPLWKPMRHEKDVLSACFSPSGQWVLTTSEDGTARVWDARTAQPISPLLRHASRVWMGGFSPDSRWVATGSDDQTVRLWDPQSGLPMSDPLWHSGPLVRLAFDPTGRRLLTFGGEPKLWDMRVAPAPVPAWFCDLVEAVAGTRLAADGQVQPVGYESIESVRRRLLNGTDSGFYARWAKWFLFDRLSDAPPPCPVN
jgi:WD40 repeat protein/serine/threonine protein kinase